MPPKASVAKSTTHTYLFVRSDHNRTEVAREAMISSPPIVGVPCLVRWVWGPSIPDLLADLEPPQPGDHGRPQQEAYDQRGQYRPCAPEGDVPEYVKTGERITQGIQEMIEH